MPDYVPSNAIPHNTHELDITTGEWADALRSGEFQQVNGHLCKMVNNVPSYCCIGVAPVVALSHKVSGIITNTSIVIGDNTINVPVTVNLSDVVFQDKGDESMALFSTGETGSISNGAFSIMSDGYPVPVNPGARQDLSGMDWQGLFINANDERHWSFSQIADYVETHLGRDCIITMSRALGAVAQDTWDHTTGHDLAPEEEPDNEFPVGSRWRLSSTDTSGNYYVWEVTGIEDGHVLNKCVVHYDGPTNIPETGAYRSLKDTWRRDMVEVTHYEFQALLSRFSTVSS